MQSGNLKKKNIARQKKTIFNVRFPYIIRSLAKLVLTHTHTHIHSLKYQSHFKPPVENSESARFSRFAVKKCVGSEFKHSSTQARKEKKNFL